MFKKFAGLTRKAVVTTIAALVVFIGFAGSAAPANAASVAPQQSFVQKAPAPEVATPDILLEKRTVCGVYASWVLDYSKTFSSEGLKVTVWGRDLSGYSEFCVVASKTVASTKTLRIVFLGTTHSSTSSSLQVRVGLKFGYCTTGTVRIGTSPLHYVTLCA